MLPIDLPTPPAHVRPAPLDLLVKGKFFWRILDTDGVTVVDSGEIKNAATTAGLNYLLETGFRGGTAITTWYAGLINGSGFTAVAAGDTMLSHSGWTEYTSYNETVRQTWTPGAASGGAIINGTVMTFTNGGSTGSIQGLFICGSNVKSGTASTLWATAVEGSPRSLAAGQTFQVYYQTTLTPSS